MRPIGIEGEPQNQKAIIERERAELTIPQIESADLVVLHDAKTGILPIIREEFKDRDHEFTNELKAFLANNRRERKRGILGRKYYLDREALVEGEKLVIKLNEARSQLPAFQTLQELRETAIVALKAAENTQEKTRIFQRYFFPTPITGSEADEVWQAVLPREDTLSIFSGLLFEMRKTVPFHARGERHQRAQSEEMKMMGPFLPEEMYSELVERIRLPAMEMRKNLRRAAELIGSLGLSGPKEQPEEESHLEFAVRVFNYTLARMIEDPSHPVSGVFSILMDTALREIRSQLKGDIGEKNQRWWGGILPGVDEILKPPCSGFSRFIRDEGYSLKGPYLEDEESGLGSDSRAERNY